MKSDARKAVYELIKISFILIILGITLGAIYASSYLIHTKIIFGGFFIMLFLIANEVARIFNANDTMMEVHMKTLLQLMLIAKKQGVKEDLAKVYDDMIDNEKGKIDFERKLTGDIDLIFYIGYIIFVVGIGYLTTLVI